MTAPRVTVDSHGLARSEPVGGLEYGAVSVWESQSATASVWVTIDPAVGYTQQSADDDRCVALLPLDDLEQLYADLGEVLERMRAKS